MKLEKQTHTKLAAASGPGCLVSSIMPIAFLGMLIGSTTLAPLADTMGGRS